MSLANVLQEVENLLKADIEAAEIGFSSSGVSNHVTLHAHQIQLEQALINLVNNAIHAVEHTESPKIAINVVTGSDVVEIYVSDNGPGLADATLIDLQEPFFSTKPSGVGMGLGLAIATEIITDHGGELTLGEALEGATFIVTLPLFTTEEKS